MTFKSSIHINAPVEEVFDFFRDPRNWRELGEGPASIGDVTLTDEGVGTSYRWAASFGPIRLEGANVFTEFVPHQRIVDQSSRSFEGVWTYSFAAEDGGTRVTMENRQVSFWRIPPLCWLMDALARGHGGVLAALKARLEAPC